MFDLRYHVASLAAVFLALVLGIVIGAAISDPTLADATENQRLRERLDHSQRQLRAAEQRAHQGDAARSFADLAYEPLVAGRLQGERVALVSVGPADGRVEAVDDAVRDAGGTVARMRAFQLPDSAEPIRRALERRPALRRYVGADHLRDVGRDLAAELIDGGPDTPLLDALSPVLVQEQRGPEGGPPVDGVAVARSAPPQRGRLGDLVRGLYEGIAGAGRAVGVETTGASPSAIPVFRRARLSTVDDVDTVTGRISVVALLAGAQPGDYGLDGRDGVVPPLAPQGAGLGGA